MNKVRKLKPYLLLSAIVIAFSVISYISLLTVNRNTNIKSRASYPDEPPINLIVTNYTATSISINWLTKNPTVGKIFLNLKSDYDQTKQIKNEYDEGASPKTVHNINISGLNENSEYVFFICSGDDCSASHLYGQGIKQVLGDQSDRETPALIPSATVAATNYPTVTALPSFIPTSLPSPVITQTPTNKPTERVIIPTVTMVIASVTPVITIVPSITNILPSPTLIPFSSTTIFPSATIASTPVTRGTGLPIQFKTVKTAQLSNLPYPLFGKILLTESHPDSLLITAILKRDANVSVPVSTVINSGITTFSIELTNAKNTSDGNPYVINGEENITLHFYWVNQGNIREKTVDYKINNISPIKDGIQL